MIGDAGYYLPMHGGDPYPYTWPAGTYEMYSICTSAGGTQVTSPHITVVWP